MTDNKVQMNTRIAIVALGVNNYQVKDNKVFPGMMLLVTDKKGTPVLKADDLFAGDQGHPPTRREYAALDVGGRVLVTF
jgi:hypothetical protein